MTDKIKIRKCVCCEIDKDIEEFPMLRSKFNNAPYRRNYCISCEDKKRCLTCKKIRSIDRFYVTKCGRWNTYKCKNCYKEEFQKILKVEPL